MSRPFDAKTDFMCGGTSLWLSCGAIESSVEVSTSFGCEHNTHHGERSRKGLASLWVGCSDVLSLADEYLGPAARRRMGVPWRRLLRDVV